jgi:hypothetical protein
MIGLNAEFEYPSHDKILNVWPLMQVLQNAATILTQKNGTQHTLMDKVEPTIEKKEKREDRRLIMEM